MSDVDDEIDDDSLDGKQQQDEEVDDNEEVIVDDNYDVLDGQDDFEEQEQEEDNDDIEAMTKSAVALQSQMRRLQATKKVNEMRQQQQQQHDKRLRQTSREEARPGQGGDDDDIEAMTKSAVALQSHMRRFQAKKKVDRLRQIERRNDAYNDNNDHNDKDNESDGDDALEAMTKSAVALQSQMRKFQAKKKVSIIRESRKIIAESSVQKHSRHDVVVLADSSHQVHHMDAYSVPSDGCADEDSVEALTKGAVALQSQVRRFAAKKKVQNIRTNARNNHIDPKSIANVDLLFTKFDQLVRESSDSEAKVSTLLDEIETLTKDTLWLKPPEKSAAMRGGPSGKAAAPATVLSETPLTEKERRIKERAEALSSRINQKLLKGGTERIGMKSPPPMQQQQQQQLSVASSRVVLQPRSPTSQVASPVAEATVMTRGTQPGGEDDTTQPTEVAPAINSSGNTALQLQSNFEDMHSRLEIIEKIISATNSPIAKTNPHGNPLPAPTSPAKGGFIAVGQMESSQIVDGSGHVGDSNEGGYTGDDSSRKAQALSSSSSQKRKKENSKVKGVKFDHNPLHASAQSSPSARDAETIEDLIGSINSISDESSRILENKRAARARRISKLINRSQANEEKYQQIIDSSVLRTSASDATIVSYTNNSPQRSPLQYSYSSETYQFSNNLKDDNNHYNNNERNNHDDNNDEGGDGRYDDVSAAGTAATTNNNRKIHKVPLFKRMLEQAIKEDFRFQKEKNDMYALSKMKKESQVPTVDEIHSHMREHDRVIRQKNREMEEAMLLRRLKTLPPKYVNETVTKLMASMKPNEFQSSGNREKFLKSFNLKVAKMAVENLDLKDSKNSKYNYKSGNRNVDSYVKATGLSPTHSTSNIRIKVSLHKEREEALNADWEKKNRLRRARDYAMKVREEMTLLAAPPLASVKAASRADDTAARLRKLLNRRSGPTRREGYSDYSHDYAAEYDNRHIKKERRASSGSSYRERDEYDNERHEDFTTPRTLLIATPKRVRFIDDAGAGGSGGGIDSSRHHDGSSSLQSRQQEKEDRMQRLHEFERVFDRERQSHAAFSPPRSNPNASLGYSPDGSPMKSDSTFLHPPAYSLQPTRSGGNKRGSSKAAADSWVTKALFSDAEGGEDRLKDMYEAGFSDYMQETPFKKKIQ